MQEDSMREAQLTTELARQAGVTLTDDELARLMPTLLKQRADLERLRSVLQPGEEPAHAFAPRVRRPQP
jgi:hypothetical protein